jgi:hypothetical protein
MAPAIVSADAKDDQLNQLAPRSHTRRNARHAVAAVFAAAAALSVAACSDDSSSSHHSTEAAAPTCANQAPLPTVSALNAEVQKALSPATSPAERASYFEGVSEDPKLPGEIQQQFEQNKIAVQVTGVQSTGCGQATATGAATINGKPSDPQQIGIVYEDGKWKISKDFVCRALNLANIASPACPAAPTS